MRGLRLLGAVGLWMAVLGASTIPVTTGWAAALRESAPWLPSGALIQAAMLVATIVLIALLSRGRFSRYGFRMATGPQIRAAFVAGTIAAVAVHVVPTLLSDFLSPTPQEHSVTAGFSFIQMVVMIWIVASTCEEVFHRGLVQSFLEPLKDRGVTVLGVRLSVPVMTAAILFGATHIAVLTTGANGVRVAGIIGSAIVLGLVAGYYRERTGSLLPAVLVHTLFNVYGWIAESAQNLLVR